MNQFSSFILNFNFAARKKPNRPSLTGDITVLAGTANHETSFFVAAFGPKQPKEPGGREYYDLEFTPKDPIAATRRFESTDADNKPANFELSRVNTGRVFIRSDEEIAAAKEQGKDLPKLSGHGLVMLGGMTKPAYLDLPLWKREGAGGRPDFLSGNAVLHDPAQAAARREAAPAEAGPSRPRSSKKAAKAETLEL